MNRMLKFTLCALLLSATGSAYAQVQLNDKDKTVIPWAQFAATLNDPSTLVGSADSTKLHLARVAYLGDGTEENIGAKKAAENAAQALTEAQSAYDEASHNVTEWQAQIASLTSQKSKYTEERADSTEKRSVYVEALNKYNLQLKTAQDNLKDLNAQLKELNAAPKIAPGWLNDALEAAEAFETAYDDYQTWYSENEDPDTGDLKDDAVYTGTKKYIYYKYTYSTRVYTIYVSFSDSYEGNSAWTKADQEQFDEFRSARSLGDRTLNLYIDFGPEATPATQKIACQSLGQMVQSIPDGIETIIKAGTYNVVDPAITTEKETVNSNITSTSNDITRLEGLVLNLSGSTADGDSKDGLITKLDKKSAELKNSADQLTTQINNLQTQLDELTATVDGTTGLTKLRNAVTSAQTSKQEADTAATTAREDFETALKNYNDAVAESSAEALEVYKEVTLTEDITANVKINSFDGHIEGNGHVITLGSGASSVFGTFSGTLIETAVNGKFSTGNNNAVFNSVANWNGNSTGIYYNANGIRTANIGTLGQLGFLARDNFGVNFAEDHLVALTDASKVYSITTYNADKTTLLKYVQITGNKEFVSAEGKYTIPNNRFAKSATTDVEGLNLTNVFFGENNTCENVEVKDKDEMSFYCPVDIYAENVTYNRQFKSGMSVVCLPFEMSYNQSSAIEALCTYDRETPEKFWFKTTGSSIPANTPALIVANSAFKFENLTDVTIKKTESQIMVGQSVGTECKSYGNYKVATRDDFVESAPEGFKIYGLTGGVFEPASASATFPAFRMAIYSDLLKTPSGAPRRIGILDEMGVEIPDLSGVENLEVDNTPALNIDGAQGEIIFTADADYGKVEIYTLEGRMVAVADVVAGTTSVSVQNGVYIVMGKKVLVK